MTSKQSFVLSRGQYCDSDDEDSPSLDDKNVELKILVNSSANKALILLNDISSVMVLTLIREKCLGLISTVIVEGQVISKIYGKHVHDQCASQDEVVLVHNLKNNLEPLIVNKWLKCLSKLNIEQYFIVDGLYMSQYPVDLETLNRTPLFMLETPLARNVLYGNNQLALSTANSIPLLPHGVVLSGAVAAIINYCQSMGGNCDCVAVFVSREAAYSVEAGQALEAAWPLLESYWGGERIPTPPAGEYLKQRKRDSFLHTTENLYS